MTDVIASEDQLSAELMAHAKTLSTFYVGLCQMGFPSEYAFDLARDVLEMRLHELHVGAEDA